MATSTVDASLAPVCLEVLSFDLKTGPSSASILAFVACLRSCGSVD